MANLDHITVDVEMQMTVSEDTAEICKRLLEIYSTKTGKAVKRFQKEDGSVGYEWEDVTWQPA